MNLRAIRDQHKARTRKQARERIVADPMALLAEYAVMERAISTLLRIVHDTKKAA